MADQVVAAERATFVMRVSLVLRSAMMVAMDLPEVVQEDEIGPAFPVRQMRIPLLEFRPARPGTR